MRKTKTRNGGATTASTILTGKTRDAPSPSGTGTTSSYPGTCATETPAPPEESKRDRERGTESERDATTTEKEAPGEETTKIDEIEKMSHDHDAMRIGTMKVDQGEENQTMMMNQGGGGNKTRMILDRGVEMIKMMMTHGRAGGNKTRRNLDRDVEMKRMMMSQGDVKRLKEKIDERIREMVRMTRDHGVGKKRMMRTPGRGGESLIEKIETQIKERIREMVTMIRDHAVGMRETTMNRGLDVVSQSEMKEKPRGEKTKMMIMKIQERPEIRTKLEILGTVEMVMMIAGPVAEKRNQEKITEIKDVRNQKSEIIDATTAKKIPAQKYIATKQYLTKIVILRVMTKDNQRSVKRKSLKRSRGRAKVTIAKTRKGKNIRKRVRSVKRRMNGISRTRAR